MIVWFIYYSIDCKIQIKVKRIAYMCLQLRWSDQRLPNYTARGQFVARQLSESGQRDLNI